VFTREHNTSFNVICLQFSSQGRSRYLITTLFISYIYIKNMFVSYPIV